MLEKEGGAGGLWRPRGCLLDPCTPSLSPGYAKPCVLLGSQQRGEMPRVAVPGMAATESLRVCPPGTATATTPVTGPDLAGREPRARPVRGGALRKGWRGRGPQGSQSSLLWGPAGCSTRIGPKRTR